MSDQTGWIPDSSTVWVPIDSIVGWNRNPNRHPPAQVAQLAASLRRFGFVDAVTIARIADEGVLELRAGHGRIMGLEAVLKERALHRLGDGPSRGRGSGRCGRGV